MEKLISVIIPTYNAEKTIERAVKSIIGDDVEIIIVIDGATDKTLEICKKIKKTSKRTKQVHYRNFTKSRRNYYIIHS